MLFRHRNRMLMCSEIIQTICHHTINFHQTLSLHYFIRIFNDLSKATIVLVKDIHSDEKLSPAENGQYHLEFHRL